MQLVYQNPTKNNKNSILKPKKEIRKGLMKPSKKKILESKRKEIKKSLMKPSKKKILKLIIKEIKKILHNPIINRDEKIGEIKKILDDPRNNLFKQEEDHYKPVRIGNAFSSIKYMEIKAKYYLLKTM